MSPETTSNQPIQSSARPVPGATSAPILTAVLLAVGSELTVGETHDTNGGELALSLSREGVRVLRIEALPDDLPEVVASFRRALDTADLVVSTGGLGPTPDDLTREAIAAVCGETPTVDPGIATWLRSLFERRGMAFPEGNLKQAWLIPSATAIPNDRGTAPGWLVDAPAGGLIVALPGPPAEMRAMWRDGVLPRLRERGLGEDVATTTLRLGGIGESHVAALLGELLHAANPIVATYARADAVDVRISARSDGGRPAAEILAEAERAVEAAVGRFVWGHGDETWPAALERHLAARAWRLGTVEVGTGGSLVRLLGDAPWLSRAELSTDTVTPVGEAAAAARRIADVGLAVRAVQTGPDTLVEIAAAGPWGVREDSRTAFLSGSEGRRRSALTAVTFLVEILREQTADARQ